MIVFLVVALPAVALAVAGWAIDRFVPLEPKTKLALYHSVGITPSQHPSA